MAAVMEPLEPAKPDVREAQHLPPKSYAEAAVENVNSTKINGTNGSVTSTDVGTGGKKEVGRSC